MNICYLSDALDCSFRCSLHHLHHLLNLYFSRLQDADDGFFEKFGSLLRQKSQVDENVFKTSLAPFNEEEDEKEITFEKTENGSCTDSGLDIGLKSDESSVEIEESPVQNVQTFDMIKESVFGTHAICFNVSKYSLRNYISKLKCCTINVHKILLKSNSILHVIFAK